MLAKLIFHRHFPVYRMVSILIMLEDAREAKFLHNPVSNGSQFQS